MREQFRIVCADPSYMPIEGNGFFVYTSNDFPTLHIIEKAMIPLINKWIDLQN